MINLKVEGLSYSYSSVPVLQDVNFEIHRGECVAILGTNGTGKSTLLKCLNRILRYKTGTVLVSDKDVRKLAGSELAKELGYVPQQLQFADTTVFDAILMGRRPYIRWEATSRDLEIVDTLMERMKLTDFALRSVTALSGGEAQKVAIARALAQQPQVLLFDEPTSNLDIRNQMEVVEMIKSVAEENNLSVIVTMHDLNLAVRFADKFIMMKDGTVYAAGDLGVITPENIKAVYGVDVHVANVEDQLVIVPV